MRHRLYNWVVRKNENVQYEYERYVIENIDNHQKSRLKRWKILWDLCWHYRIRKKDTGVIYCENIKLPVVEEKVSVVEKKSSAVEKKPSIVEKKLSIIEKKPPVVEKKLPIADKGPSMKDISNCYILFSGKPLTEEVTRNVIKGKGDFKPAVQVFRDNTRKSKLKYKTDYSLEYLNTFVGEPGVATCVIVGRGKYTGCVVKQYYKIDKKQEQIKVACDSSESQEAYKRIQPHVLLNIRLLYADVVTFDIFDTLLFRPFAKPADLFLLLGEKHNLPIFSKIRQEAEAKVRNLKQKDYDSREIYIEDIYKEIERLTGIPAQEGIQAELDLEYELIQPNPYMLRLFNMLKRYEDIQIILISNMYLHDYQIEKLLKKCGYEGYDKLYVSCDYNVSKHHGRLFELVKSQIGKDLKYVHIGDNKTMDVEGGQCAGFETEYYFCPNDRGEQYRATGLTELVGSAYKGIVNNYLLNGITNKSKWFEMGFIYGSLYIMGYMSFLHKHVMEKGIEKILFLARDGAIYKRVYEQLFPDIDTEYVYYSRMQNIFIVTANNFEFLNYRLLQQLADRDIKKSFKEILEYLYLDELEPRLHLHGLQTFECLDGSNLEKFQNFIITHKEVVLSIFEKKKQWFEKYFDEVLGEKKKFAIVDVGWEGSAPATLSKIIEAKGGQAEVFLAGDMFFRYPSGNLFKTNVNGYVFSRSNNSEYADDMKQNLKNHSCEIFEAFSQDTIPSFKNVDISKEGNISFNFCYPDLKNNDKITEIHDGVMAFVREYQRIFKNMPAMFNVPSSDVYKVIKVLMNNPKVLQGFQYNLDPFSYSNNYRFIIREENL